MNLDALLKTGRLPWSPNQAASGLDVWHAYDHPLTGTFTIDGTVVLFTIVSDFQGTVSVWAYTCLTGDEAADLDEREFGSVDELRRCAMGFFEGRKAVFALAEDLLIRYRSGIDNDMGSLPERAASFVTDVAASAGNSPDPLAAVHAKLAQVAVAERELADA